MNSSINDCIIYSTKVLAASGCGRDSMRWNAVQKLRKTKKTEPKNEVVHQPETEIRGTRIRGMGSRENEVPTLPRPTRRSNYAQDSLCDSQDPLGRDMICACKYLCSGPTFQPLRPHSPLPHCNGGQDGCRWNGHSAAFAHLF
jgi:hypothetical protein